MTNRSSKATPIRDFVAWPGKRNYEGLWWSSTIEGHVPFESLLEREFLLAADFDPQTVAIAAQPLAILWPRATPSNVNHVPDFFIRLAGGDGRIVDVRHPDRVTVAAQQSALTRRLCDRIGWQYQQFTGLAAVLAANLRWLAGYRHDRHTPSPQVREALISAFARPAPPASRYRPRQLCGGRRIGHRDRRRISPVVVSRAACGPGSAAIDAVGGGGVKSVRLFDCLQFDGASWQVVAQEGTALSLKNLATARIRSVEIADLLGDESYLPECSDRLPDLSQSAILETLDPDTRQRTTTLHRHVVEVLTGVPPVDHDGGDNGVSDPKPQFDPKNRLGERVAAKAEELRHTQAPISERMLWRYLAAYRRDGIAGLVDRRKLRESNPAGRMDARLISLLDDAIRAQTNISTGTKSRVIAQVTREAAQLGVPVPSRPTLYRVRSHATFQFSQ
ncbi:TnsA-like heteromeric transposase endonuclease subunit [Mycobacteroides saopaulense]|uniref:TnsA-like heteromeric transposase endonuclease subunit n=1 Tax=Mycobacteroides saopaulense TaxID=1578165 RepID=UPI001F1D8D11|nr:TnsA-like heteromeric transposase endonuclease subunit [Mycobacteroides saopaulense]